MAVGICTVVCLALTMFAFQTKYDFTMLNGILFVCLIILMIFGLFAMIFPGKVTNELFIYGIPMLCRFAGRGSYINGIVCIICRLLTTISCPLLSRHDRCRLH